MNAIDKREIWAAAGHRHGGFQLMPDPSPPATGAPVVNGVQA